MPITPHPKWQISSKAELLIFTFFPSPLVWSANSNSSVLTSKASSKVNLLNDDTY